MNKIISILTAIGIAATAQAAPVITTLPAGAVTDASVKRANTSLLVSLTVHPDAFPKTSNRETVLRPAIVAQGDTLFLDPVVVAGRTRYIQQQRNGVRPAGATLLQAGNKQAYAYQTVVDYDDWMQLSELIITARVEGCCGKGLGDLADYPLESMDYRDKTLHPVMVYIAPTKEIEKTRSVSGSAFIDFPVGKTQIFPDYRRNPAELAKIKGTIDEIRKDKDITITSLSFKGYASPEGSYAMNERLAKGRTEALIEYVRSLYAFPRNVMHSSWEAEDWAGLQKQLAALNLDNKDAMMAIVTDAALTPDQKDLRLKEKFPQQYAYLLEHVYPSLRHSDYNVNYKVRNFIDLQEIAMLVGTAPQKLSLDELFVYAKSIDMQSPEYREVMEIAVRLYPDDPEANLNAAATAASFGDYTKAREYLSKAGDNPVAAYTAGVIEAMEGNYPAAAELLKKAENGGVAEATQLLTTLKEFGYIQ